MSLTWIAVPHIGADTIVESKSEQPEEIDRTFSGGAVVHSDLPTSVVREGWTSMTPRQMRTYAGELHREITSSEESYETETIEVISDAVAWLDFWADENVAMETEW